MARRVLFEFFKSGTSTFNNHSPYRLFGIIGNLKSKNFYPPKTPLRKPAIAARRKIFPPRPAPRNFGQAFLSFATFVKIALKSNFPF